MFESKQSDYWYNESTREFFVCAITSVSAAGPACRGDFFAHYPLIYRIDRETNKKTLVYPSTSSAQVTSASAEGYVYNFVPDSAVDISIEEIDKPLFSYNEKQDLYNITFTGHYADKSDGLSIFTYTFQYVDEEFHNVDARVFVPESKNTSEKFTFESGHLNKRFFLGGTDNATTDSFFGTVTSERPPNYRIRPYHEDDYLTFNTITYPTTSTLVTADSALPMGYSAGFIAQRGDSLSYSTDSCIRVDFTCKSFVEDNQIGFLSTKTVSGTTPSASSFRAVAQYTLSADTADGFCVFFYTPEVDENNNPVEVGLRGTSSSFGYTPASAIQLESGGFYFSTSGITLSGLVAVAFDIDGNFCTSAEGKSIGYDGTTYSQSASTIGVRGGADNDYKVLGRSGQISSMSLCETVTDPASAVDRDFRVELIRGDEIMVSGKLSTDSEYTVLYALNIADLPGYSYTKPPYVKVGLSSSTGTYVHNFKLKNFQVKGVSL